MKKRNPLVVFLLSIITFGIYDLYWLVKTKQVLNKETRFHTPTIWLLIVPYLVLIAGYILLFTAGTKTVYTNTTSSSSSSSVSSGEQLNTKGTTRPPQYLHICTTSNNIQYVSQGTPDCLGNDSYQGDYSSSVPGTLFSSPCQTTVGALRYVYISQDESCPSPTSLVFYNNLCPANAASSADCTTPSSSYSSQPSTTSSGTNSQVAHPARLFISIGLIIIGFLTTFGIGIFWFFRFSKAINEYTKGKMSTAISFLILWLIHLIGVALIQDTFNDMQEDNFAGPTNQPMPVASSAPMPNVPPPPPPTYAQQPVNPPTPPVQTVDPLPITPLPQAPNPNLPVVIPDPPNPSQPNSQDDSKEEHHHNHKEHHNHPKQS